ncbi:MAG: UvrD-helicase domain-containing protein [Anaerosomatales bacterium]|nr:UvrD-helicase domain-containing protein [Anaerosomatales bacterium]MDT8433730.1 UvrD-helicase domain-containing protein [Anaerosomatales bacterium]
MTFPLNEGQERAASTLVGPVLISAGAGTGKTRALTERFVRAVIPGDDGEWTPAAVNELLTITFTEKAAGELVERIRASLRAAGLPRVARDLDAAWISTIHGFCARILRRHALEAGLDPGFSVADETDARQMREEAFEQAARLLHESSVAVSDLFADYGFEPVWDAASLIAQTLDTYGLTADDIAPEPVRNAAALLDETRAFFAGAHANLVDFACESKGAANHADACRSLLDALDSPDGVSADPAQIAAHLWRALEMYSARGGSAASIKDVCEEVRAIRGRLLAETVATMTATGVGALAELTRAYAATLAALKAQRGILDFADLQLHTVRLLEQRSDLSERYRSAFRLVMVDEFQDTDELQLRIVQSVAGENLCTVGDERQSIYRFRGADLDVYRRHRDEMLHAGARPVELVENYRSHPDVIGLVNDVFSHPAVFGDDLLHLQARRTEPEPPFVEHTMPRIGVDLVHAEGRSKSLPRQVEAEALARRFAELRDAGVSPGDMVVLVRRYASADVIAAALRREGFPVLVVGGRRFLDLPEVTMVRALARVIANPRDDTALAMLLLSPMSAVSDDGLWLLRNAAASRAAGRHLWDGLGVARSTLPPADAEAAAALRRVIERARDRAGAAPLAEVLTRAVEESGADLAILDSGDEGLQAFANVVRFVRKAAEFEQSGRAGAADFVARIDAEERFGFQESPSALSGDGSAAVRIMSIHASKGLEFPVVALPLLGDFVPGDRGVLRVRAREGRIQVALALPSSHGGTPESRRGPLFEQMRVSEAAAQAEEAKRLFYVACTRAREVLLLSGACNLEKDPAAVAESPLSLARRALGPTLQGPPGTDETRVLGGAVSVSLRIHDGAAVPVAAGPSAAAPDDPEPPAGSSSMVVEEQRACRVASGVAPERPERLSYSDIATFESCSLRYWAQRVARLGSAEGMPEGDPRCFGSALHAVLQLGRPGEPVPAADRIEAVARFYRLGADELARLREGVGRFARSDAAAMLESCETVRREHPFSVRIAAGKHVVDLVGAMDAVGRRGQEAVILDYKSGTSKADAKDLTERYEMQARCYAYAALADGRERVRVVFVRPEVESPDGGVEQIEFEFSREDVPVIEKAILGAYDSIATSTYRALERWDERVCSDCRIAGTLCPLSPAPSDAG